jgi:hypothetical protein
MGRALPAVRSWRRLVSTLLLLTYLPACSTWQVGTPTPAQFVEQKKPHSIRVTRTDGSRITLTSPMVRNDSILGNSGAGDPEHSVALALSDVQQVEVRKIATGKTLLLVGGILVAVAIIGCAASGDSDYYASC